MRVVDAEDLDSLCDPVPDDAERLRADALRVVVEVDRVDVLVLLRRVLRVRDRAVRKRGEPLRVRLHPWVVRRGLQSEVERDLDALRAGRSHEGPEVRESSEVRVDRVVTAFGGADRPRRAGVAGLRIERVVAALAVDATDRMDRGEVQHVEAHRRDGREPTRRGAERAALDRAVLQPARSLRAGEEFVPGADAGALALDQQFVTRSERHQRRQRSRPEERGDRRIAHDLERRFVGGRGIAQSDRRALEPSALGDRPRLLAPPLGRTAARPVSRMTAASTPAAIFRSAACSQVAKSSPNASNRNPQTPSSSGVMAVSQRSKPSLSGCSRCSDSSPDGEKRRTCTPMRSWPSRNAVVRNGTISPAKALGRNWPSGTDGEDRAIGMREVAVRAIGLRVDRRANRDGGDAAPGGGARRARRRDHVSNLPRALPRRQPAARRGGRSLGQEQAHGGAADAHDLAATERRRGPRSAPRPRSTTARRRTPPPRARAASHRSDARCRGRSAGCG